MHIGKKFKKITLVVLVVIIAVVITVIAFISPIAKYVIEKYSPQLLGRQVKMSWVYLNPFTGYVHFHNLKIYESKSDSLFLFAPGVSARFAMLKMLKKTYEFEYLTLDKPKIEFVENHKTLNLDDIIKRFTPKGPPDTTKEPVHFNLLNISINNGEIHYNQLGIPVFYYVKKVNIKSSGLRWDTDTLGCIVSLENGPAAGDLKAQFMMNLKSLDYRLHAEINKFDLNIIDQYMRDLENYGSLRANLDANILASGNFTDQLDVDAKGYVAVNDVHFGANPKEDYAYFKKLAVNIIELNPKNFRYYFDTIMLDTPYFKYERYDYLDNVQNMFGKNGQNITDAKADDTKFNLILKIADYINIMAKNFIRSYYKINRITIYKGNFQFNDYSLREKFSVAASPFHFFSDTIDKNKERMTATVKTGIKPYGFIQASLSLDPNDYGYFDLKYKLMRLPLAMFNPYVISYTSFPLDRGALEFNGGMVVEDSNITCNNHLLILDPRVDKRLRKKDTKWIPVPLILSIARERSDVIDYEIPIRGRLNDPKFKFWNIIGHTIANIFIKPPSTPYLVEVKRLESEVEKSITVKWDTRANKLRPAQEKFVNKIADFLASTPEASITVSSVQFTEKEQEYILLFEAKKKYFLTQHHLRALSEGDSIFVDKMSVKDSAFVHYLNKQIGDTQLFTIQQKCEHYLGDAWVKAKYKELLRERKLAFLQLFESTSSQNRVKFATPQSAVPFNGFSYYKIDYQGDFPKNLMKAYEKIDELNEQNPRGKYQQERKKNGGVLPEETALKENRTMRAK